LQGGKGAKREIAWTTGELAKGEGQKEPDLLPGTELKKGEKELPEMGTSWLTDETGGEKPPKNNWVLNKI